MKGGALTEKLIGAVSGIVLPLALLFCGGYYLAALRFVPFRHTRRFLRGLSVGNKKAHSPGKAVAMALAGTLGVGNVTGVADAVMKGGPGVLFWMIISALPAVVIRYAEVLLALIRRKRENERMRGGAMYYIKPKGLAVLFCLFGILCGMSVGGAIQSSAVGQSSASAFGGSPLFYTLLFACISLFGITRKTDALYSLTSLLVPAMSFLCVILFLAVIVKNAARLPGILSSVFLSAFGRETAISGCTAGFLTSLRFGVIRGLLSNEAGCGTAPIAHSSSETAEPASEAWLGFPEVFVDTVLLCTLTGLTLLCCPSSLLEKTPMLAVISALSSLFGKFAAPLLSISLFAFALAAVLCWSVYLDAFLIFLSRRRFLAATVKFLFCLILALSPLIPENIVWNIADLSVSAMTLINLAFLMKERKAVISETGRFLLAKGKHK